MNKQTQNGFHLIAVVLVLTIIGVIGAIGYRVVGTKHTARDQKMDGSNRATQAGSSSFAAQYKDACKDREVSFTSGPMPASQLSFIEPLGKVSDGHVTPTDHVYVHPADMNAQDNSSDAVMPADGTIVEVSAMPSQYIGDRNQQTASEDHRLVISHSCRYYSIFIHVHKLDPVLVRALGGPLQPNQSKRLNLELKAGDKVGRIGGNGFDWTPLDTSKTLTGFITPALYQGESWKVYTVSPFDLYSGSLKKELEAKSLRVAAPLGGKIDWDTPGKLIGNWFRSGSGGYSGGNSKDNQGRYWDGHLSIAPDYIDGTTPIVSIGNWDGKAKQLVAKGSFNPASVTTATGPIKVELAELSYTVPGGGRWSGGNPVKAMKANADGPTVGTILFEVQTGEKLKVEKFIGKSAAQVSGFSNMAETYER